MKTRSWKGLYLLVLALLCVAPTPLLPTYAQDSNPPPHLGYGIHIAPNTNLDVSLVNALGVDWVKLYDLSQTKLFPDKHVLYRLDLPWPNDWSAFKTAGAEQAPTLARFPIHRAGR